MFQFFHARIGAAEAAPYVVSSGLVFLSLVVAQPVLAQAPATPAPTPPPQTAPAAPRPAPRPATGAPVSLTFQVTDTLGAPLAGAQVRTETPVSRDGLTDSNGSLRFTNMRAGTYRVRVAREGS